MSRKARRRGPLVDRDLADRNRIRAGARALEVALGEMADRGAELDGPERNHLVRVVLEAVLGTPQEGGTLRQQQRQRARHALIDRRAEVLRREREVAAREQLVDPTENDALEQIRVLRERVSTRAIFNLDAGIYSMLDARAAAAHLRCGLSEDDLRAMFPLNWHYMSEEEMVLRRRLRPPAGFPEPAVSYLACGPLWVRDDLDRWLAPPVEEPGVDYA